MKYTIAFLVSLLLSAALAAETPALLDLKDVSPLRGWFQSHGDSVRLIAILSPSCDSCVRGLAAVHKTLQNVADPRLRVAVVWEAAFPVDKREAAVSLSSGVVDGRLTYFWDPYRASGETWQSVLKLKGVAWDVYLVYAPAVFWNGPDLDPGPPAFWMHQLKDVPGAPELDQPKLEHEVRALLK